MIQILLFAALMQVHGDAPAADPAPAAKGADLVLLDDVRVLAKRIEGLRGQPFTRPPVAVRVPDDVIEVAAAVQAGAGLDPRKLAARGRAWAEIGLGDTGTPRDLRGALARDLAGVGFDPGVDRLLVGLDRLTPQDFRPGPHEDDPATLLMLTGVRPDELLVAHALAHLRQREREGSSGFDSTTTDRLLAQRAWREGEANLLALLHFVSGMGLGEQVGDLNPKDVLDGRLAPPGRPRSPVAEELVRFVYEEGFARSADRMRAGGWAALDRAMAERETTRDVLHDDRGPLEAARFDEPEHPSAGTLDLADEDSIGEAGVVALVSTLTGKDNLGLQAGDGWAGDRLYRWEHRGSASAPGVTVWLTRWVSPEEAADFDYAYGRALTARFPGRTLEPIAEGERVLTTPDRVFRVERKGLEVRVRVLPVPVTTGTPTEGGRP